MRTLREVWVEFGDGSVAKYAVKEEDFLPQLNQLLNAGISCTIWVDGRIWAGERKSEDDMRYGWRFSFGTPMRCCFPHRRGDPANDESF